MNDVPRRPVEREAEIEHVLEAPYGSRRELARLLAGLEQRVELIVTRLDENRDACRR